MAKNIQLLERVLGVIEGSLIEARDDGWSWDQATWGSSKADCGTTGCFAGRTLLESGYTFRYPFYQKPGHSERLVNPMTEAGELLGLELFESIALFDQDNDLEDMRLMIKFWAEKQNAAAL